MNTATQQAIEEILPQVAAEGMAQFRQAVADKKIIFSEELLRSFELEIIKEATSVTAQISFSAYGRYKDMKFINRHRDINLSALEKWIEEVGVSKFAFIPGYERSGHVPADSIAIKRLARAISHSYVSVGVIKRKTSGTWYNETKMRMLNAASRRILARSAELIAQHTKQGLETPT